MAGHWRDVPGARVPRDWMTWTDGRWAGFPDVYDVTGEREQALGEWRGVDRGTIPEPIPGAPARGTLYERVSLGDGSRLALVRSGHLWHMVGGAWGAHSLNRDARAGWEVRTHWRGYVARNVTRGGAVQVWCRFRRVPS